MRPLAAATLALALASLPRCATPLAPVGTPLPDPSTRTDSLRPLGDGAAALAPIAHIADERIAECSGLAHVAGWWWTHNDSGDGPFLFRAASPSFEDARRFEVPGARAVDWEEVAAWDGDVLVCDIGDNGRARDDATLYRVRPTTDGVETVGTYPVAYPDGRHDAEGAWVWDGRVHVVLKDRGEGASWVYRFDDLKDAAELAPGERNVPTRLAAVTLPPGEQVTAADVSPDGIVALLTYSQLLLYRADRVEGTAGWTFRLHARQCEAVAWDAGGVVFANEQRDVYRVDHPEQVTWDPWIPARTVVDLRAAASPRPLPVERLHAGEHVEAAVVDGALVVAGTLVPEAGFVPSETRLGTGLIVGLGTRPLLRVSDADRQIAVVASPAGDVQAMALDFTGAIREPSLAGVRVEGHADASAFTFRLTVPASALDAAPGAALPPTVRLCLAGNGFRAGDDEPVLGGLDVYSVLRPFVWAELRLR